jgi:Flp pilus assembly protein TadD
MRLLATAACLAAFGAGLAGCKTTGDETTGSIGGRSAVAAPRSEADWRREVGLWEGRYRENPKDTEAAINYAQSLRATGQRAQAVAVLEQATLANPNDKALLGAYGRALADTGKYDQALDVLGRAHTPEMPDWRILSAQGAVLDQMGRHDDARTYYVTALRNMPNEPTVLSNLGLSYALSKDLPKAEETLKLAVAQPNADPRARQNLALVIGLQGRFQEAEAIVSADLPPSEAEANVSYLRQMLARNSDTQSALAAAKQPPRTSAKRN